MFTFSLGESFWSFLLSAWTFFLAKEGDPVRKGIPRSSEIVQHFLLALLQLGLDCLEFKREFIRLSQRC